MPFITPWKPVYFPPLSKRPHDKIARLTIEIPVEDRDAIMSVAVNQAIFSLICQSAVKETAQIIRDKQLTYGNSTEFIKWLCERTFTPAVDQADAHDVTGRETGVCGGTPSSAATTTSLGEAPASERGGEGTKGGGKSGKRAGKKSG